jgi:hypothetical protein
MPSEELGHRGEELHAARGRRRRVERGVVRLVCVNQRL